MEELSHHGINGQRWGVQNGPPYPLRYDDYTPAERKEADHSQANLRNSGPDRREARQIAKRQRLQSKLETQRIKQQLAESKYATQVQKQLAKYYKANPNALYAALSGYRDSGKEFVQSEKNSNFNQNRNNERNDNRNNNRNDNRNDNRNNRNDNRNNGNDNNKNRNTGFTFAKALGLVAGAAAVASSVSNISDSVTNITKNRDAREQSAIWTKIKTNDLTKSNYEVIGKQSESAISKTMARQVQDDYDKGQIKFNYKGQLNRR